MHRPSFADPANLAVGPPAEVIEATSALGFLQAIYRNNQVPLAIRIRAAIEALPFESPKLSATAVFANGEHFASLLERAIERSGKAREIKLIDHRQVEGRQVEGDGARRE